MHSLLETYLSEVEATLSALPTKQRAEELREMRTHLENAVTVGREMGRTEDEAVADAVAQFGTPEDLGGNIVWAWRRGETRDKRSLWGAATCALALSFLLSNSSLSGTFLDAPVRNAITILGDVLGIWLHIWRFMSPLAPSLISGVLLHSLAGGLCGLIFPKRALLGAMLGIMAWYGISLAILFTVIGTEGLADSPYWCRWMPLEYTTSTLSALGAAWAVSRWRNARISRARLVRG